MTRDHDPLHSALAAWVGLPASLALQLAAGETADRELADLEEAAVLALQKLLRRAGLPVPL